MNDFEVREMAGVRGVNSGKWVQLKELNEIIRIGVGVEETDISIADARKLANQLRRLALRIEKRIVSK